MRFYFILFFLLVSYLLSAQYSCVGFSEKTIARVAQNSKSSVLYVVIDNEKDPSDAAVVNAVKNYWKIGAFKFISKAQFLDLGQKDELLPNTFYLCEWFEGYEVSGTNALEISAQLKKIHTGVYNLAFIVNHENDPKEKNKNVKKTESINLRFDLSASINNNKEKVIDGYYDLMLKYFNNEIHFCQNMVSVKDVKKEDKDGIVYFGQGMNEVQTHDILLIKEQVTKMRPKDKKESKKVTAADAVAQFNAPKNVFTVFPDDIKLALNKGDKQVYIYSNDMLLSAYDGAVIAAPNIYSETGTKRDGFLLIALSVLVLSYGTAILMK